MTEPPPERPRQPTTSLAAFRDSTSDDDRRRVQWLSESSAATFALSCGVGVLLATVILGLVGSLPSMQTSGRPVIVALFVLLAAIAVLAAVAAIRTVLGHRRTGLRGRARAIIGALTALASVALLASILFSTKPAERAPGNGPITLAGPLRIASLLSGDCLAELPPSRYDDPTATAEVVPCDEPYVATVAAVLDFPSDEAQMIMLCEDATRDNGQVGDLSILAPTQDFRENYHSGQLLCLQG